MTIERRIGQPTEGQQPFGGGKNAPRPAEPQATHGPPERHGAGSNAALDKQRPPEAGHLPPEEQWSGQVVDIVDVLEREVIEYISEYGEEWYTHYFDHFHMHLPSDNDQNPIANYRTILKYLDRWNIPLRETMPEEDARISGHSELRLDQTASDFYGTVDKVLQKENIDSETIVMLRKERKYKMLYETTLPAYIGLRGMGYTMIDLD